MSIGSVSNSLRQMAVPASRTACLHDLLTNMALDPIARPIIIAYWPDVGWCEARGHNRIVERNPSHPATAYGPCNVCLRPMQTTQFGNTDSDIIAWRISTKDTIDLQRDGIKTMNAVRDRWLHSHPTKTRFSAAAETHDWRIYSSLVFDVIRRAIMRPLRSTHHASYIDFMIEYNNHALERTQTALTGTMRVWCFEHSCAGHMLPIDDARHIEGVASNYKACGMCRIREVRVKEMRKGAVGTMLESLVGRSTAMI